MADPAWVARLANFAEVCARRHGDPVGGVAGASGEELADVVRRIVWRRFAGRSVAARMSDRRLLRVAALAVAFVERVLEAVDDAAPTLTAEEEDLLARALRRLGTRGDN